MCFKASCYGFLPLSLCYGGIGFPMDAVWTDDQNLKVFGLELGARMTVVDCGNENLFVHSPIRLTEISKQKITQAGSVRWVVAPNKWHHMFVGEFKDQFPQAEFFCAPGLDKKKKNFTFSRVISNEQNFPWNPFLSHLVMEGIPALNEVVFFHPETRTLILTDLVIHINQTSSSYTKFWLSFFGVYKNFGWSAIEKVIFIRDKSAFKKSMESLLKWDFDRIVLSHGDLVPTGGKKMMVKGFVKANQ